MLTTLLLAAGLCAAPAPDDPARAFDSWIGEWSVSNRHMADDGTWRDGDTTRARITPVCDGAAVLEDRERAADEVTQDRFFAEAWTDAPVSPHEEARALDGLVGEWRGEHADGSGATVRETLSIDGDRLTLVEEAELPDGRTVPIATTRLTRAP